jgi:hypothetical protein
MSAGVVVSTLPDAAWGSPRVGRIIPSEDSSWGRLAYVVGTPWEAMFPAITSEIFDAAQRGHATPLMRQLGVPGARRARRLPVEWSRCGAAHSCDRAAIHCVPGVEVPLCWEAGGFSPSVDVSTLALVVQLWKENIPVIRLVFEP